MIARLARVSAVLIVFFAAMNLGAATCVIGNNPPQPPVPPPTAPPCMPPLSSTASGSTNSCPTCAKSPCYLSSGTYAESYADLQIPTAGMYPLNVTRRYDSGRPVDGPMGVGWSSTLTAHLYYAAYLQSAPNTYTHEADIVMPSGAFYRFSASGSSFVSPPGTFDTLVKNADNTYSLTLAHTRSVYRFNTDGSLASLTDDYGNAMTYSYDGSGRLYRVTDTAGSGRYLQVTWNGSGRIGSVTDNAGRVITYTYAGDGTLTGYADPIASANPPAQTTGYTYITGRFGPLLSRVEDRWHRTISNLAWYPDGRLKSYTEGDYNDANPAASTGEKYTYAYSAGGATKTDSLGAHSYSWSSTGVANDSTQQFDSATGLVTSQTMPAGNTFTYAYNARGNVATVSAGGLSWLYNYDANYSDKVATIVAPSQWASWQYQYYSGSNGGPPGALMRVSRVGTDGASTTTTSSFTYDAAGRPTSVADAMGNIEVYAYNAAGDLISLAVGGNATTYDYDLVGRVTKVTTPTGDSTSYAYDDDDRLVRVTLPSPGSAPVLDFTTRISYDNFDATSGLVNITTTDPNGRSTMRGTDALGHLVQAVDAQGNVTRYEYQYDLLHTVTDANGNVTSFGYNGDRFLVTTTFFDGAVETYTLNTYGGITAVTDRRGQVRTFQYDAFGRLTSDGVNSFYYAGQNLASASGVTYTYDPQWHIATETQTGGDIITYGYGVGSDLLVSYRLDPPFGQPGTAVTATFAYDSAGRVNSLQWSPVSGSFGFAYAADGQYSSIRFPNGQSRTFSYDRQGRLTTLANLDVQSHNLLTFAYTYDYDWGTQSYASLGNRTSVTVTGSVGIYPNGTTKYTYDSAGQLTGVTRPDGTVATYGYDAIGNRTSSVNNGVATTFTYYQNAASKNSPRLRNALGGDLSYDANGNLTTGGYSWDVANRLSAISGGTQYQYDYENRRNLYTPAPGAGSPVRFVNWGANIIAERSSDGGRTNDYVFGAHVDEPLARRASDGSLKYYVVDGLGSVVGLTAPSGQLVSTATYDEWGSSSGVDMFGYTGREFSRPDASLWSYRARYYRPGWGRFVNEDPLPLLLAPAETYRYVRNSPLLYRDPTGRVAAVATGGALLGTLIVGGFVVLELNQISPLDTPTFPVNPPAGAYPPFKPPKPTPNPQNYHPPLPKACNYPQLPGPQAQPPKMPKEQCVALCAIAASEPAGPKKYAAVAACVLCLYQAITGSGDPNSFKPPNGPWNKP